MPKLSQVVAVEKATKTSAHREWEDSYHRIKVPDQFEGSTKTYEPIVDGGETLPPVETKVQYTADEELLLVRRALTKLLDVTATKDYGNVAAKADVVLGDNTILSDVPVPLLLALEKYVSDMRTYFRTLPELDRTTHWSADPNTALYRGQPVTTNRTAKRLEAKVLYQHTDKHPAQVESFTVDQKVGEYTTTRFSGAVTKERKDKLVDNADNLLRAIRFAREEANRLDVEDVKVGDKLLDILYAF